MKGGDSMSNKYQLVSEMANDTLKEVTQSNIWMWYNVNVKSRIYEGHIV